MRIHWYCEESISTLYRLKDSTVDDGSSNSSGDIFIFFAIFGSIIGLLIGIGFLA